MFSKVTGKAIAVIKADGKENQILYVNDGKNDVDRMEIDFDNIDDDFYKKPSKRKTPNKMMKPTEIEKLKYYLMKNTAPFEDDFKELYETKRKVLEDKSKYEVALPEGYRFEIVPSFGRLSEQKEEDKTTRFVISGIPGSGKSYQGARFVEKYHAMYPKNKIYLFSTHSVDKNFDDLGYVSRVDIFNEDFMDELITIDDLSNSLCIFDDVDNLQNKKLSDFIFALIADLVSNGRKPGISVIIMLHQLCNYKKTKGINADIDGVMLFFSGTQYTRNRFLKEYIGLSPKQIKYISKLRSSWAYIGMKEPQYVISEHRAFILNPKTDDEEEKQYMDIL